MIAFGQPGYTGMPDYQRPSIYIKGMRRDGKISVTYVYPISGRRIGALLTPAKLAEEKASGKYNMA